MALPMQGFWQIKVKSHSARFKQQYVIEGAIFGNGTFEEDQSTWHSVVGGNWTIRLQHINGTNTLPSTMQITPPRRIGRWYIFDIEANDSGLDGDFNDLVLSCRMLVTNRDFLIYGQAKYYEHAGCYLNPCNFDNYVIETHEGFIQALKHPTFRSLIQQYYPSQFARFTTTTIPQPTENFTPIVLPIDGGNPIPDQNEIITLATPEKITLTKDNQDSPGESINVARLESLETRSINSNISFDKRIANNTIIDAAKIAGKFRLFCSSGPLSNALLQFQEYDRSASELNGGAYQGDGNRETLGRTFTDHRGNYIFRFTRNESDNNQEIDFDVAEGQLPSTQKAPDIIVQLRDPFDANAILCETAPYWNIPFLRRINLCFAKSKLTHVPLPCDGHHIIQRIGNIALASPNLEGHRIGFSNYLTNEGLITAFNGFAPQVRCAAWRGKLILQGCLSDPNIKYYTISIRKGSGSWKLFTQELKLPVSPDGEQVANRNFGPAGSISGYLNVEINADFPWLPAFARVKAHIRVNEIINGTDLTSTGTKNGNGIYEFRIQAYAADGTAISGVNESIKLYLNDENVFKDIDPNITMLGETLGDCALFTLPKNADESVHENAPLAVRFKVEHNPNAGEVATPFGFINAYKLSITKGATGSFAIVPPSIATVFSPSGLLNDVANTGRSYDHPSDNLACEKRFKGTANEPSADGDDFYTASLSPETGGWLEASQKFCAFTIHLNGSLRLTNGSSGYPSIGHTSVSIGIQRPEDGGGES